MNVTRTKPRATLTYTATLDSFGRLAVDLFSNAKKVKVTYRLRHRNRTKTAKLHDGTAFVLVPAGATRIKGKALATKLDRAGHCWGANAFGQLGDASTSQKWTPGTVVGLTAASVDADWYHACAALPDHSVSCWGGNGSGQLGDSTTTTRLTPVSVAGL